ncbi:MAG: hypothetical protein IKM18_08655, partial [Clostridia bacterium]|nr:hypothetical protein [Clostridia bacterium]
MKKLIALILLLTMAANVVSCSMQVRAKNLMDGITPNEIAAAESLSEQNPAVTDFAVRLFKASEESGKNTLISPLSVLCA